MQIRSADVSCEGPYLQDSRRWFFEASVVENETTDNPYNLFPDKISHKVNEAF